MYRITLATTERPVELFEPTRVDPLVKELKRLQDLLGGPVPEDPQQCREAAVESVFLHALRRWFGVIFWFAVLGVAGAYLYRGVNWLAKGDYPLSDEQRGYIRSTLQIMDWPAAQLMTLSLAIATDFDSVFKAWKAFNVELGHCMF